MAQWAAEHEPELITYLQPHRQRVPSVATLHRVLSKVPIELLESRMSAYTTHIDQKNTGAGSIETKQGETLRSQAVDGKTTTHLRFAVTSLPRNMISLAQAELLWHRRWTVENQLHYVRDVSFSEDQCQVHYVRGVSFTGGFSCGAQRAGIAIDGRDVTLSAMHFYFNSSNEFGGAKNTYPGILLGMACKDVTVTGCRSGQEATQEYQSSGCQVDTTADGFVIVGNDFRYNVLPGVNNGAGTGSTKLIANNI